MDIFSDYSITAKPARAFDFAEDVPRPRGDLKPRVKVSHDERNEEPPTRFTTALGLRMIPRRRFPQRPSADMTKKARQGVLTRFLHAGEIIRASDLGPIVDLKTAKLNLTDKFELETDYLSEEEERMPENQRIGKNLFYVAVMKDELPSYHFWKAKRDSGPVHARGVNHSQLLKQANTNPHDAAMVADFQRKNLERRAEYKRQVAEKKRQSTVKLNPKSTVKNAWTEAGDGEFFRHSNPKRESQLRTENLVGPSIEPQWRPQGTLLGVPFDSSDQRDMEISGQFGPQPGDKEWEKVEASWEQRLQDEGLKNILETLKKSDPEKYSELIYGIKSSRVRPARGDDEYARQFNDVLKASIPTVAFKLTQQHFERPVSPINSQEPLIRGANPQGWDLQGEEAEIYDGIYEVRSDEEDELGFLNFYTEKSDGELRLRRRNPIPDEHVVQELSARNPHLAMLDDALAEPSTSQQVPAGSGEGFQTTTSKYPAPLRPNFNRSLGSQESDENLSDESFSGEELSSTEPSNQLLATVDKRQSERQTQRDLKQQAQPNDTIYISESSSLSQQPETIHEKQASRLHSKSVYDSPRRMIGLPQYGPNFRPEIRGGLDFPTIYPRVLTIAEIKQSQRVLRLPENQILNREQVALEHDLQSQVRQARWARLAQSQEHPWRSEIVRATSSVSPKTRNDPGTQRDGPTPTKIAHKETQKDRFTPTKKAAQGTQTNGLTPTDKPHKKLQTESLKPTTKPHKETQTESLKPTTKPPKETQKESLTPTRKPHKETQTENLAQTESLTPTKRSLEATQTNGLKPRKKARKEAQTERAPGVLSSGEFEQTVEQNDLLLQAASPVAEPGHGSDLPPSPTLPPNVLSNGRMEQTAKKNVLPLQAASPVAETGHEGDLPPSPTLPLKEKGKSYYCNICYIDTTRKNEVKKVEHALACGTTIDKTLVASSKADAMRKEKVATTPPAVNKKAKVLKPVTPGPRIQPPRTRGRKATSPLAKSLAESDGDLSSPGGLKRKRTKTPRAEKKATLKKPAPKKRRR